MPSLCSALSSSQIEELRALREDLWSVPRMFAGETVFCFGAGPSLRGVDPATIPGRRAIACNSALARLPGAGVAIVYGRKVLTQFRAAAERFAGEIVTINSAVRAAFPRSRLLGVGPRWGRSPDPSRLAHGFCAGHGAIDFAAAAGAARIVLVGYEMSTAEHLQLAPGFGEIASDLRRAGVECVNATPGSALDCFERVHLRDFLKKE